MSTDRSTHDRHGTGGQPTSLLRGVDGVGFDCARNAAWRPPLRWTPVNGVEGVLQAALKGLSLRQRTIADNIANIETPGFLAGRVDFETSLREATAAGRPSSAVPTVARSLEPTRADGNNVNIDTETVDAMQTNMRYELTVMALTNKFNGMRAAIGAR